ncbi:MAG: hypothetical protein HY889_10330 [Deltaproteobacteria bacterium]|nr:hypothetical protein [Deltaproteobacteria bacterium]
MTRVVCGLANKCNEAACPHRLPHDRNLLCDETCDMGPESKGCIGFAEYMTGIKLRGGKNIEPYNGGLPVKILRKED